MTNNSDDQPTPPEQPESGQPGYWGQQEQPTAAYGQPYPPGPPGYPMQGPVQYAPDHPRATTSLVLGILGIVPCQLLAPFAWWIGKKTLDEIDASGGRLGGRTAAQAGYIMGIIGTVLLAVGILFMILYFVVIVAVVGGGMATTYNG
ncbi:MAG TPA: DUF4190 domain-containing protein [Nocardioidaceae bacterium]|nr:DUF4190 domain-containing protein [Nocardioidaceae bacterium]